MNGTSQSTSPVQGYRARRMLTMNGQHPVLDNALLWVGNGHILSIGPYQVHKNEFAAPTHDLGEQTVVPGIINAHTHLELSHLHNLTLSGQGFLPWVQSLLQLPVRETQPDTILNHLQAMHKQGVAGIGDISGQNPGSMHKIHARMPFASRLFVEFLGFQQKGANSWPLNSHPGDEFLSAAGHALYSTHPELLQSIKSWTIKNTRPFSIHLAEHSGEVDLLTTGRGNFAQMLRGRVLPLSYVPPGLPPVAYADRLGLLDEYTLAVHCVHIGTNDIRIMRERGVHVCLCPRSNAYINCGRAPAEDIYAAGVALSLGTDGLSSNQDLNLWHEASYLAAHWEGNLSLTELVSMITINPAQALGLEHIAGSLQPGKLGQFSLVPDDLQAALPV
ncbi:MAG: amidohydrolase family protein [Desulfovermiculus sp.]